VIEVVIVEENELGAKQAHAEARAKVIEQLKDVPLPSRPRLAYTPQRLDALLLKWPCRCQTGRHHLPLEAR
jgi:hypothetical protein